MNCFRIHVSVVLVISNAVQVTRRPLSNFGFLLENCERIDKYKQKNPSITPNGMVKVRVEFTL